MWSAVLDPSMPRPILCFVNFKIFQASAEPTFCPGRGLEEPASILLPNWVLQSAQVTLHLRWQGGPFTFEIHKAESCLHVYQSSQRSEPNVDTYFTALEPNVDTYYCLYVCLSVCLSVCMHVCIYRYVNTYTPFYICI